MPEKRKLSTILFADIAGYTALMQSDEPQAMQFLSTFKSMLEQTVPSHDGEIVQYFGDACLLSFDSTSQAVRCAMTLQPEFQQKDIPVRIGIHLGEVVFKENNVFGDGVNVASRIESISVPGAILVSKAVRNQIKNNAEFKLTSLGTFEFKNVQEAVEVFAISNGGFMVPNREDLSGKLKPPASKTKSGKWLVPVMAFVAFLSVVAIWVVMSSSSSALSKEDKKRPVAVIPFENQTMDNTLDAIGLMAMDWVSKGLLEGGGAKVIKRGDNTTAAINLKELTKGAEILVKGRYYNRGPNDLMITADVLDAKSQNVLFSIDPLTGKKDDPMQVLTALQQKLIGYWRLDGNYLGRPPRYDAYQAYLEAISIEATYPYDERIALLEQALDLDSTFAEPLFELYVLSHWGGRQNLKDPTLKMLRARSPLFSPYQKLRWQGIDATSSGDIAKAAEIEWEIYETYQIYDRGTSAISKYTFANHSNKVVELYHKLTPVEQDTSEAYMFGRYVLALYELGRYDEVLAAVDSFQTKLKFSDGPIAHVLALTRQRKLDELDRMLEFYRDQPIVLGTWWDPSMLIINVCFEMYMRDMTDQLPKYIDMAESWISEIDPNYLLEGTLKARFYNITGAYASMYEEGIELWDRYKINFFGESAGIALLKLGREKELEAYIEALKNRPTSAPGYSSYAIGAIEAQRDKEVAMTWLKKAVAEGFEFNWYNFRHDPALKPLMDYQPFLEFTEPK